MGPVLESLIKLQSVENRLRAAKAKLARSRRNVIIQENQVRSFQNALEAKQEEIKLTRVQSDRLELELKSRDEEIARYRTALNTAKSNKEYAAVLTHLNTTKADNSKIEAQILELMKDVEADDAECKTIREQIAEQKKKLEDVRRQSEQSAQKFEQEINQIQSEWDAQAKEVPSDALDLFKRVADTYDGEAIATIDEHDDAYSCDGCFMGLTTETVNLLMSKDDIIRCPNCTRILVLSGKE